MAALDNPCDGPDCNAPVRSRRKSVSGKHFCQRKECQAAKQAFYRGGKTPKEADAAELDRARAEIETLRLSFISTRDLLFAVRIGATRKSCLGCGRQDAFPNFPHPHLETREPCYELVDNDAPDPRKIPRMILDEVWVD